MEDNKEFYNKVINRLVSKFGKDVKFSDLKLDDFMDAVSWIKLMEEIEKSIFERSLKNVVNIFKSEETKGDLINVSQFNENIEDTKDLSFVDLYVDYKTNQICVQTGCKNSEGKSVVKATTYLIKNLNNEDNKIDEIGEKISERIMKALSDM